MRKIEVLVDDTLCRHGGPRIFGAAMHRDPLASNYGRGSSSGRSTFFACGHSWVVLAMRLPLPWDDKRGIAVPFLFRLYRSKKRCPEELYSKRTELARELIKLLETRAPNGVSASCCGRPRKVGERLPSPSGMAADEATPWTEIVARIYGRKVKLLMKERVCLWATVAGEQLVRVIVTRDPKGVAEDRAFFCTDPKFRATQILEIFSRRWLIEVCFRDAKQSLGLQDPQNGWSKGERTPRAEREAGPQARGERGALAVRRTAPLAFTAQAVVLLWYLEHGNCARDVRRARRYAPWYRKKERPSFRDMLAALRRETWTERLFGCLGRRPGSAEIGMLLPDAMLAA